MKQNNSQIREIKFPEIDLEKVGDGSLPREETVKKVGNAIKFLVEVRALKQTSFLAKSSLDKAKEIGKNLEDLVEQFPQIKGVAQNAFGRLAKEMAEENGDSKSLFNRLQLMLEEAVYYGSLQEWEEERLESVPFGLKEGFLVRLRSGKDQFRYFLPSNWRSEVHKRTALVLRDLTAKATLKWMDEKGIEPKSDTRKPTEPAPADTPKTSELPIIPAEPATPKKSEKPKKDTPKTPRDQASKQVKTIKAKDLEKTDKKEIREIKSLSNLGKLAR